MGKLVLFCRDFFYTLASNNLRFHLVSRQLEFVGNKSFLIVFLASLFTGGVLGLQLGVIFKIFGAESLMGATTGKSLALELAPVMCSFIVTGRAGAAMAAEIATMRVNEQIDAIEAMGVNPMNYLVVPRVIASILMTPLLTILFLGIGVIGSYIVGVIFYKIDSRVFTNQIKWLVLPLDIWKGFIKAIFFGFIFSIIACYKGFYASGGAKGVGEATTRAVVLGLLTILIVDFVITLMQV